MSMRPPLSVDPVAVKPPVPASNGAPPVAVEIPDIIVDTKNPHRRYERGKFLGKGGFAKCYELKDMTTGEVLAGKIVPKTLLVKQHQRDKMAQEIQLHRTLAHPFVVKLYNYFEDNNFVYVILELCRRRSLMELHKRRKAVSEPETRYFMNQILLGVKYLHENRIIHRDLKLGNIFLNDNMEIKLGDFGLATRVDYDGERKRTLCGTPNYIAPEVLNKKGHSYEVDVWSLGCILYTLMVGKPPFETQTLKDTYAKIKRNEYQIPSRIGGLARNLITRLLQNDPTKRPRVSDILRDDFMTHGYLPPRLPVSCLTMAPRFDTKTNLNLGSLREPLTEINKDMRNMGPPLTPSGSMKKISSMSSDVGANDFYLAELQKQLRSVIEAKPALKVPLMEDEAEDPKCLPMVWVSKWVDYSDKYGFGYALSDESIGVLFNDATKLLLLSDGSNIHYIDFESLEHYYMLNEFPSALEKKVKLLNYFRNYMKEHLLKAGANIDMREGDELSRIPWLRTWFRTSRAVVMHLTNGTVQINFFKDHTKIILCPLMGAVTYIDEQKRNRTFRFDLIEKFGCSQELSSRLTYAYEKVTNIITNNNKKPALMANGK